MNTVVDIATLTGAAIVALGNTTTGVVTNDQKLYEKMQAASEQCGERIWQLPSFPEYLSLIHIFHSLSGRRHGYSPAPNRCGFG